MPPRNRTNSRRTRRKPPRRRKKKSNLGGLLFWSLATIAIVIGIVKITENIFSGDSIDGGSLPSTASSSSTYWWSPDFSHRIKINTGESQLSNLKYRFDHSNLVSKFSSARDGSDLRLVVQLNDLYEEIPFQLEEVNSSQTEISFDISEYPDYEYYLYFGNKVAQESKVLGLYDSPESDWDLVTGSDIESPTIALATTKSWVLKRHDGTKLNILVDSDLENPTAASYFYFLDEAESEFKKFSAEQADQGFEIDLGKIPSGEHKLGVIVKDGENVYRSNNVVIKVSAPVFVAMTVDWEGRNGEQDWALNSLASLARKYDMPLTHFFNPRIYLTNVVPEYRSTQLTNWVKNRAKLHGDEIGLHLHMFFDLVREAGVEPKRSPYWGSGNDGYDTLSSSYSQAEYSQILQWSLNQFAENGLPSPNGFRAGGWFANTEVLNAVNDSGFVYDSSGRDEYRFGSGKVLGHWNLKYTQQPYYPSLSDQNVPGSSSSLNILEFPNNGNDSYWHSLKQLKDRFYLNYKPESVMDSPVMVTYLTHLDWYATDKPKLEKLFAEIDKYSYRNDAGPVVYTTISDTIPEWD